ncbi:uncharacterized protein F5147DRAFT_775876 [Suillus discolor]|uniref:Uncharacterized protein n=1 Tax=Suillus discolor TaxID=1912936 RepID=A0A9P7F1Y8_9AGAM|nr:uncharacterized protein F5147DRAFT_775876 [Suillus discolor]KAG2103749.1 hypothetical protein F5147DRAFT_775876 [Suillus discolor]
MSMSDTRILMREQRDMLKQFLPGFKLVCSGSVEEQNMFWENAFTQWFMAWPEHAVYYPGVPQEQELSDLQQASLKFVIQCRQRMPQKWTTDEQEEFLIPLYAEFRECTAEKRTEEFWTKVKIMWFKRWPERKVLFGDLPVDYVLTPDQVEKLAAAVKSREQQLTTWYWWQKNPLCLGHTSGVKGVLKFNTMLAGGIELKGTHAPHKMDVYSHEYYEEKVKDTADTKIRVQNVTDHGPKLNKRCEVTHHVYSEESEEVKDKIERKYQKAKAKHAKARLRQKSGKLPKIDDKTKIKAIHELCLMLDWILKYLAYATGGWKFSILMGGNDPSTGEVSVYNYHVGELESGAQFDQTYANFDAVQAAFLMFVKDALVFESTVPQGLDAEEGDDSLLSSDDDSNEERVMSTSGDAQGRCHVEADVSINTTSMYRMTPQSESSIGNDFGAASSDASLTSGVQLTSDSHFTSFNNHDLSGANLSVFDYNMFTTVINDPSFYIRILDFPPLNACHDTSAYAGVFLPLVPSVTSFPNVGGSGTQNEAPYPEVFLPPVPPATSFPNVGGSGTQNEALTLLVEARTRPHRGSINLKNDIIFSSNERKPTKNE